MDLFQQPAPRMLVLGLDAADATLVEKWSDQGELPTLSLLRKRGLWIPLQKNEPMPSAAVWPTIYTGTYPGKHGIYNGLQLERGKQAVALVRPSDSGQRPFWQVLDSSGKRSIIFDGPFDYPLRDFSGIQILDWGTYERHYPAQSSPVQILGEISRRFGAYPFGDQMSRDAPVSIRQFQRARSELLAGVNLKGNVIEWLISHRPWDFLMAVFSETHPAGHYFWSSHAKRQNESPAVPPEFSNTIKDIYKAVDAAIANIIATLDETTMIVVLSGQGMGPNNANWQLIPKILSRLGLLVTKSKDDGSTMASTNWLGEIRNSVPLRWRRSVSRRLPGTLRDCLRVYWANAPFDWSRTRAFHLPTDQLGYIRINLKGREPRGTVKPGSEYNDICNRICKVLKTLVNLQTGNPIVREVYHADDIFPGPHRSRLPDLIVTWRDEPALNGAFSEEIGRINGTLPDLRSGNHKTRGFALFCGPGVKNQRMPDASIVDIAPTILKYFGLHLPCNFDGRALAGVF
jgi:predicted AlkP superfamily phosphohydrolase/phosphomutase